jgi:replicative DNA helicase
MDNEILDFLNRVSIAIFDNAPAYFSELNLQQKGGKYVSVLHRDGKEAKSKGKEKTIIERCTYFAKIYETDDYQADNLAAFYVKQYGGGKLDVLRPICEGANIEYISKESAEHYEQRKEEEAEKESAINAARTALFSEEGKATREYLQGRGYSQDQIVKCGFGYINADVKNQLSKFFDLPAAFGAPSHPLLITWKRDGQAVGLKARAIDSETTPKYIFCKGSFVAENLFLQDEIEFEKDAPRLVYLCEGEFDALAGHAQGLNIVASAGNLKEGQARILKQRIKAKTVCIIADNDKKRDTEEKEQAGNKEAAAARELLHKAGIEVLRVSLPAEAGDLDEYFNAHGHTREDFDALEKEFASVTEARILGRIAKKDYYNPALTFLTLKMDFFALYNSIQPTERAAAVNAFAEGTEKLMHIMPKDIELEAEAERKKAEEEEKKRLLSATVSKVKSYIDAGNIKDAEDAFAASADLIKIASNSEEVETLLQPTTAEDIIKEAASGQGREINTGLFVGKTNYEIIFPAAAVSFVAAPTGNGKSTLLRQIAIQTARQQKRVFYFTLEESRTDVFLQMLAYCSELECPGTFSRLKKYYNQENTFDAAQVCRIKAAFDELDALIKGGYLNILSPNDADVQTIINVCKEAARRGDIAAVCVDYIQWLNDSTYKGTLRREEIKGVCQKLAALAKESNYPIICAAQMNRDAKEPALMTATNIADSSDVEKIANTIICIWNSNTTAAQAVKGDTITADNGQEMTYGEEGKIFCKVVKNRNGIAGGTGVFYFDGDTKKISMTTRESESESENGKPFEEGDYKF